MSAAELLGYVASVLVAVSLSVSSVVKLRWLNLLGAIAFSIYGLWISAIPVFLVNFYIAIMDVYYLIQIYKTHDIFEMVPLTDITTEPVKLFIEHYRNDIQKFFPDFLKYTASEGDKLFALYRNFKLIGFFGFRKLNDRDAEVFVDYVTPEYRDFKFGRYIYHQKKDIFMREGIQQIITRSYNNSHTNYLKKIGFTVKENNQFEYRIQ